jgi:hypothetical protein
MATFRRIIQISAAGMENKNQTQGNLCVTALCDDGSLWESIDYGPWRRWDVSAITDSPASGEKEHG